MKEMLNGWMNVQYGFVKKINESVFEVIRINNLDEYVYVEFYDKVDITTIQPSSFERYGTFEEYLEQKTNEEKAMYAAVFSLTYDDSITCYNESEVKEILFEEKVLEGETFDLSLY